MSEDRIARDREQISAAREQGTGATLRCYARLSGPGWLQSAITLGGGSLAGSLYLGVLTGFSLMWLQPLAMLMGVVMLASIGYVALSTDERPFRAINRHVNPVLGWGWALATLLANMVWSLPQFALGTAAVQQNLIPALDGDGGKAVICVALLAAATTVIWFYDTGARGIRIFERVLKVMVGIVVLSFFGVIVAMTTQGALPWGSIFAGFVPDLSLLSSPAPTLEPHLQAVAADQRGFWVDKIVADQRDVMVTAAATAVGINMTFLLPYSLLARGWGREFRGLATFDLGTGLLIPFVLATSCVVIAASQQFHAKPDESLVSYAIAGDGAGAPTSAQSGYVKLLEQRVEHEAGADLDDAERAARLAALPEADRRVASMLVRRDAFDLARSLAPLTGSTFSQLVFGIGVLGMALSTIIILMLISGFVICEMLGVEPRGAVRRWGSMAAAVGVLGPFVWTGDAKFWLAVPTSVFGMALLPIAYLTFLLMMNSRGLLGDEMPRGGKRVAVNVAMLLALGLAGVGAAWSIWSKAGVYGAAAVVAFLALAVVVHFARRRP